MFWFNLHKLYKLCVTDTHGHDFSKTTYPVVKIASDFQTSGLHICLGNVANSYKTLERMVTKVRHRELWTFGPVCKERGLP